MFTRRQQFPSVRGSPLICFILLAIVLTATGFGLMRVTSSPRETPSQVAPAPLSIVQNAVPYRLMLSAPARSIQISSGAEFRSAGLIGKVDLDSANPSIALRVVWENPTVPGERRFAKLTAEVAGQATFHHVFDAPGDIDDYVELPMTSPSR
jgi:hypothetical protein